MLVCFRMLLCWTFWYVIYAICICNEFWLTFVWMLPFEGRNDIFIFSKCNLIVNGTMYWIAFNYMERTLVHLIGVCFNGICCIQSKFEMPLIWYLPIYSKTKIIQTKNSIQKRKKKTIIISGKSISNSNIRHVHGICSTPVWLPAFIQSFFLVLFCQKYRVVLRLRIKLPLSNLQQKRKILR